ncbi:Putative FKBP-type peptidyl-prolyl cis-trans isomerase [Candidatus Gugararchaeum adminiculabundum]|nr:Putative FKBP-type peptidyl-prolyl cis-trans isomerase [Candidatus Gugararchaeum adminiculabundum]
MAEEKLKEGDFIKLEYSGKLASSGKYFDTTSEEVAKANKLFNPQMKYLPQLIVVGKGYAIKGIDEALIGASVGESKTVEVSPEKGFGAKDPSLVSVIPLTEFHKREINPVPGLVVTLDGKEARVKSVSSGRVMVDMNHPLAGEKLVYELKVIGKITKVEEKVSALLERNRIGGKPSVKSDGTVEIINSPAPNQDINYFFGKAGFIASVLANIPEAKKVRFIEDFVKEGEAGKKQ